MRSLLHKQRGFSLLEMIVYTAILTFLIVIIMNILISLARSQSTLNSARSVGTSGTLSLERIAREVRGADSIDVVNSVFDTHPGVLVLNSTDEDSNPRTVEFSLVSDALHMTIDDVDAGALTQTESTVTNLTFSRFVGGGTEGVRVEISLTNGEGDAEQAITLYTSAVVRKSQ